MKTRSTSQNLLLTAVCFFVLSVANLPAMDVEDDRTVKTWKTAELVGAMRWAKAEADTTKEKLDFTAAEIVCKKRLNKQVEAGKIKKSVGFLISERVRKKGIYRGEKLTLERAEDLRKMIIAGRIFEKITD